MFLNRGDHFESAPLPREAQRAPAFGVGVGDLDGDSHDDLILAQNFYGGLSGSPRYDAGRGLWLRGNGDGGFHGAFESATLDWTYMGTREDSH